MTNPLLALCNRALQLDHSLYKEIRVRSRNDHVTEMVRKGSKLGEHGAIWLVTGAVGAIVDRPRRRQWQRATVTVAASYMTSTAIKLVVRRSRPTALPALTSTPTGLSFPSSHATTSFAAARAFSPLLPNGPLYLAAIALGCSRLYLGVHYPSDIAAGAVLGTVVGSLGVMERGSNCERL